MMVLAEALSAQDATQNVWHRRFGTRKPVITPALLDAYNAYLDTQQQPPIPEQSKKYCEPLANAQLVDAHLLAQLTARSLPYDASKLDNLAKLAAKSLYLPTLPPPPPEPPSLVPRQQARPTQ